MSQVFISGQQSLHLILVGGPKYRQKTKNKQTKQLKMRSKCQKDLFSQCFCPKTDHRYAHTALSVLFSDRARRINSWDSLHWQKTRAGRTRTDAEIWAVTFFVQRGKNERVPQPFNAAKRGYLGLLFLCNFLCNCTRWIPFLDVGAVFLRQEILLVCWTLRPQQSRERGE